MKNKEKYAKEILDIVCNDGKVAMLDGEIRECSDVDCELCGFHVDGVYCRYLFTIWANNEYVDERPVDWSKVKADTPIWVRHRKKDLWVPRYFAKYENDRVYAWDAGATSWSAESSNCVCDWEYAQIAEREE